ncbi:hypothetical protein [Sphingobacterium bovistauri]|uniref:Uncharacterized protein n=1 Tax=Sphingobacterium bovistauri TaxID=2781959 RepID=A0ABS7Z418_9SPHI|nr:hypothetical protein [Sphingobacterium bovistauri]MCA5003714.1 hypothetical protein [Sphingobacterium bovistauri]
MAIIKRATNIKIEVQGEYNLQVGGKVEKIANKINIQTTCANLVLASNKKVVVQGGITDK